MEVPKIVGLCIAAAIGYGIAHDQVTARVCIEYFTIGHPPIFGTQSPTLLAIGWGIGAFAGFGLPELLHYDHPRGEPNRVASLHVRASVMPMLARDRVGLTLLGTI